MKTSILKLTLLLFGTSLFAQNTWTVDNRPGTTAQFTSVQAAHDAASPGDFIYIHPSPISYDNVNINKEIHLRGIGHNPELANGEFAKLSTISLRTDATAGTNASNSSISGLNIQTISDLNQAPFHNILIQNNRIGQIGVYQIYNWIVQGNVFSGNTYSFVFNGTLHANNIISHNIFNTNSTLNSSNSTIQNLVASETFSNNIIITNSSTGSDIFFSNCNNPVVNNNLFLLNTNSTITRINTFDSNINFQNCLTFAYGGQTIDPLTGTNNLDNINPMFVNIGTPENPAFAYNKSYKLQVDSPAIDAGSDGDDLGIYGQGFLFQMKGYPFDLPYPTSININNAVVEAGGNLEVVFKASANVEN